MNVIRDARGSIQLLNFNRLLDWDGMVTKEYVLKILYNVVGHKFIDNNGKIKEEFLLSNTTKDDRRVSFSFAEYTFSDDEYNPAKEYIEGRCEIDESLKKIDEELGKRIKTKQEMFRGKRESNSIKHFRKIHSCITIDDFEDCTDAYIKKVKDKLHERMSNISDETFVERLLIFFAKEIDMAIDRKDADTLQEIFDDMWTLEDYFLYKG